MPFVCCAEHDDRARYHFEAIDIYLLSRMGREANSELSRINPRVRGSGQGFLVALKREPIELDRCKIGPKVAASGDGARRSHVAKSSVISMGVGKRSRTSGPYPLQVQSEDVINRCRRLTINW